MTDEQFDALVEMVVHGFEVAGVLGLIVVVRTFLSFSLEVELELELEGALPWRRAAQRGRHE